MLQGKYWSFCGNKLVIGQEPAVSVFVTDAAVFVCFLFENCSFLHPAYVYIDIKKTGIWQT